MSASSLPDRHAAAPIGGEPVTDTGKVAISEYSHNWVGVDSTRSCCVPREREIPRLLRFYAEHRFSGHTLARLVFSDKADRSGLPTTASGDLRKATGLAR